LLANIASNSSTATFSVGAHSENPALFTSTSMSPASTARRSISAGSLRSAAMNVAWPPSVSICSTTAAPRAGSRPTTMIRKPSRARRRAIASPRPEVAPVTRAVSGGVVVVVVVISVMAGLPTY
jgi:hypothetical protein